MTVHEENVRKLVQDEARKLGIYHTGVEPLVFTIMNQFYAYGHWNWFHVDPRRQRLLVHDPLLPPPAPSTMCLYHCLEIIKKNPKQFFMLTIAEESSNELDATISIDDTGGSSDPSKPVQAEILPITDPGCDREQGL